MIVTPLKIQGKKTKLIPNIREVANKVLDEHQKIDIWVEPFLGSGAVAFNCPPDRIRKVVVNDINPHIISFYKSINEGTVNGDRIREELMEMGRKLKVRGNDYYTEVKERFNKYHSIMDFLFLTRTGFNGVMRFNSKGEWNVPFCKLNDRLNSDVVEDLAHSVDELRHLFSTKEYEFHNESFEKVIESAPENSLFYCDPPYYGLQVQYYKGWGEEQEILLNSLLKDRTFIYSTWINDGHKNNPMIGKLWDRYQIEEISHKYNVAAGAKDRMKMVEGLIFTGNKIETSLW